jgi:hypothetical protein
MHSASPEHVRFEVIFGLLDSQDEGTVVLQNISNNQVNNNFSKNKSVKQVATGCHKHS